MLLFQHISISLKGDTMKLKEIITNVFTSKAKKAEAKRIAEEAEARIQTKEAEAKRKAKEAEARRKAKEAEAKKQAEEAAARRKVEEEEAKRKAFLDKPYETLMPMITKSLETTGKMTSEEISSLLQLDKLDDRGDLVALGFIDGNFVLKTHGYLTNNFYVIKDSHLLTISNEYQYPKKEYIHVGGGYYKPGQREEVEVSPAQNLLSFKLDDKVVYKGATDVYCDKYENYQRLSQHFDFDSNLKGLFDKITFKGKDIKSKMTNQEDINRQEEIEQQLSQSLTKYKNKQEEKALEDKKQKELERIAHEKAIATENLKAQNDRLEQNPILNVFLSSKTGYNK